MKDFPVFTTEHGVASITLKEVPYRKTAYIRLQSSLNPCGLLSECVEFARIAGAERILAEESLLPEGFPHAVTVLEMSGVPSLDASQIANLFPVTASTVARWREIYNARMRGTDNASTLESRDEEELLSSGGCYFIHREGHLLGIGWLEDGILKAVASYEPGMGYVTLNTLFSICPGERITLQVASTNARAIALYERFGLIATREVSRWHDVSSLSRKNT